MKEVLELRINNKFSDLLPTAIVGHDLGPVTKIKIEKNSPEFQAIKKIAEKIMKAFFMGGVSKELMVKRILKMPTFLI